MTKANDAFRTIGEMAEELAVKPHILRYWEEQFPMLSPLKRAGGRRHYRAEDAELLRTIHRLLNVEGYTIKGALKYLGDRKKSATPPPPPPMEPRHIEPPVDRRGQFSLLGDLPPSGALSPKVKARLKAIRDALAKALADG